MGNMSNGNYNVKLVRVENGEVVFESETIDIVEANNDYSKVDENKNDFSTANMSNSYSVTLTNIEISDKFRTYLKIQEIGYISYLLAHINHSKKKEKLKKKLKELHRNFSI